MKKEHKILVVGAVLCVVGGILLDYHILATGMILLLLGIVAIIMCPFIADLGG